MLTAVNGLAQIFMMEMQRCADDDLLFIYRAWLPRHRRMAAIKARPIPRKIACRIPPLSPPSRCPHGVDGNYKDMHQIIRLHMLPMSRIRTYLMPILLPALTRTRHWPPKTFLLCFFSSKAYYRAAFSFSCAKPRCMPARAGTRAGLLKAYCHKNVVTIFHENAV